MNDRSILTDCFVMTAVKDAEVARKAELESRSDYPKTGVCVDDFLPTADEIAVDGVDSKSTLRGLIRGGPSRQARRALQPGSSVGSLGGTTATGMTASSVSLATTATGALSARSDWPPANDIVEIRPMTTGGASVQSARTAVERTPQLPPYPLPRMPHHVSAHAIRAVACL